jgi:uncharacterized surface protein with fasciclin (FAS1) repeats
VKLLYDFFSKVVLGQKLVVSSKVPLNHTNNKLMKTNTFVKLMITPAICLFLTACSSGEGSSATGTEQTENPGAGLEGVKDDVSANDIVKVASGSKDHTTLVAAVKAAGLVGVLTSQGPYTVFAPVNAAFDALPKGTVDDLLKPENKGKLADILQYHVALGVYKEDALQDGQVIGTAGVGNITIHKKDSKLMVNDANVVAAIPATNGLIYVIDKVIFATTK